MSAAAVVTDPRIAAARDLIARGYRVVPLQGKRPFRRDWPSNPLVADDTHEGNIGVLLSNAQRLLCVDCDVKGGAPGLQTLEDWRLLVPDFDRQPDQTTPSGGQHFLLRVPDGVDPNTLPNGNAAPGMDVLRDRRQFVVAPSFTEQGEYTGSLPATPADVPLMSRELIDLLRVERTSANPSSGPDRAPSVQRVREAVARIPNTEATTRDEWVSVCHAVRGAVGPENDAEGLEIFQSWAEGYPTNDPAENERLYTTIGEVKAGWHSLVKRAGLEADEAFAAFGAVPAEPEGDAGWVRLADAFADPDLLKPPPCLIPRFAYAGRLTLLAAAEKAGKSTLIGQAIAAATAAGDFLGDKLDPAHVLCFALDEHVSDLVRRLHHYRADGTRLDYIDRWPGIEEAARRISQTGARICVLDTLSELVTLLGGKPENAADILNSMRPLRQLARRTGCAFILLHHTVRDGSRYAGSHQIGAGVDLILEMEVREQTKRRFQRPRGRVKVLPFTLDYDTGADRYDLAPEGLTIEERVLRAVRSSPGVSMNRLCLLVGARKEETEAAVRKLLDADRIEDRGSGNRWALHMKDLGSVFEDLRAEEGSDAASV